MDPWLQFLGRLHPLVLHLPIGALLLLGAAELWIRRAHAADLERRTRTFLCAVCALGTLVGVASGWLHGEEVGTGGDAFAWHRGFGIALSVVTLAASLAAAFERRRIYGVLLGSALVLLIPVGHFGAELTHGVDFLIEPFQANGPSGRPEALTVVGAEPGEAARRGTYVDVVAPILAERCGRCHGPDKQRSGLALHTAELVLQPGESGLPPITPGNPKASEILRRLRLDLDAEEHMPPRSKPQPTAQEIAAIERWIAAGAPFEGGDSQELEVRSLAGGAAEEPAPHGIAAAEAPELPRPPQAAIDALVRERVHVEVIEPSRHLLWISFIARTDADEAFVRGHLLPLLDFVSDLSLAGTSATDGVLELVARMPRLERLDLSRTACSPLGLARLEGHRSLRWLNLSHTAADESVAGILSRLPALEQVHLWGSPLERSGAEAFDVESQVQWVGDFAPARALEEEALPRLAKTLEAQPINTTCPVTGKAIDPAFEIVHERRVVGFCCAACPALFWQSPAEYPLN